MSHDHIADQEDAGSRACRASAQAAGKTAEQADNCDDGEHKCPTCPWMTATKFAHGDPCPECSQPMAYDGGQEASRADPGEEPSIYCTDCGMSYAVDWARQPAVFLTRDVAELLRVSVPELSAALQRLGFEPHSQGMAICPHEALAVARTMKAAPACPSASNQRDDSPLLRTALDVLTRYARWAADMGTELDAANAIRDLKSRLGVD